MKRHPDETYEEYRKRRSQAQVKTERKLKGRLVWDSERWGTYRKSSKERE